MSGIVCERQNQVAEHRSRKDGVFYMMPNQFPCMFHDLDGCAVIDKEEFGSLVNQAVIRVSHSKNGDKINIKGGISKLRGYNRCSQYKICPLATFRGV